MDRQQNANSVSDEQYNDILARVQSLKLPTLKLVARTLSIAQAGRKADVQDRVRRYIQIGREARDNARLLAISQIIREAAYGNQITPYETLYRQYGGSSTNQDLKSSQSSTGSRSQPSASRPWLFFRENPFFVLKKLVTPNAGYCTRAPEGRGSCRLSFQLNEADIKLLRTSKHHKLYLLCGVYERSKTSDALIEFPQPIEIHINGNLVKDNVKGIKNKPGTAKPANLTPFLVGPERANDLNVVYAFTKSDYLVFCYLVEEVSPDRLLQKILQNPHVLKESTMKDFNKDEQDEDDIQEMSTRLNLKCPISFTRMKYPVKSIYCTHLGCFDALSFIYLQEQASTWSCPLCYKEVRVKELAMNDYVMEILKGTPEEVEQVEIELDGSWKAIYEDDDGNPKKSSTPAAQSVSITEDLLEDTPPRKAPNSPVIISLDSDDEDADFTLIGETTKQPSRPQQPRQEPPAQVRVNSTSAAPVETVKIQESSTTPQPMPLVPQRPHVQAPSQQRTQAHIQSQPNQPSQSSHNGTREAPLMSHNSLPDRIQNHADSYLNQPQGPIPGPRPNLPPTQTAGSTQFLPPPTGPRDSHVANTPDHRPLLPQRPDARTYPSPTQGLFRHQSSQSLHPLTGAFPPVQPQQPQTIPHLSHSNGPQNPQRSIDAEQRHHLQALKDAQLQQAQIQQVQLQKIQQMRAQQTQPTQPQPLEVRQYSSTGTFGISDKPHLVQDIFTEPRTSENYRKPSPPQTSNSTNDARYQPFRPYVFKPAQTQAVQAPSQAAPPHAVPPQVIEPSSLQPRLYRSTQPQSGSSSDKSVPSTASPSIESTVPEGPHIPVQPPAAQPQTQPQPFQEEQDVPVLNNNRNKVSSANRSSVPPPPPSNSSILFHPTTNSNQHSTNQSTTSSNGQVQQEKAHSAPAQQEKPIIQSFALEREELANLRKILLLGGSTTPTSKSVSPPVVQATTANAQTPIDTQEKTQLTNPQPPVQNQRRTVSTPNVTTAQSELKEKLDALHQNQGKGTPIYNPAIVGNSNAMAHIQGLQQNIQRSLSTNSVKSVPPQSSGHVKPITNTPTVSQPPRLASINGSVLLSSNSRPVSSVSASLNQSSKPSPPLSAPATAPRPPSMNGSSLFVSSTPTDVSSSSVVATPTTQKRLPPSLPTHSVEQNKHSTVPDWRNSILRADSSTESSPADQATHGSIVLPELPTPTKDPLAGPPRVVSGNGKSGLLGISPDYSLLNSIVMKPNGASNLQDGSAKKRPHSDSSVSEQASKKATATVSSNSYDEDDVPLSLRDDIPLKYTQR